VNGSGVTSLSLPDFSAWDRMRTKGAVFHFDLDVTARCNLNCRHCYINLPAGDRAARARELSLAEIADIADQAAALGALWCLISGGEPLLRPEFPEIYMALKRKGLLVSLFTNATLLNAENVRLLADYPPRDVEVSVYGITPETYERVTRRPGSFAAFMRGLDLLLDNGVRVRLKAMALRSNLHEMAAIAQFCRERTKDYFRFDPLLNLRFDGDAVRNAEIRAERLSPQEIVQLERSDPERFGALEKDHERLAASQSGHSGCRHLFHCGAGVGSFSVTHDGLLSPCGMLYHPDCVYDLRKGSVADAVRNFVPRVRQMVSDRQEYLETCHDCALANLCMWCPAHTHLETGELDAPVDYFCEVAHARADMLGGPVGSAHAGG